MPNGGVLCDHELRLLVSEGGVSAHPEHPIADEQIQPNSLDLRIGSIAYRTRCSFLPVGQQVSSLLRALATDEVSIASGFVIECGLTYVIPLVESLDLPKHCSAVANPKSSTGRLDLMVRVFTENGHSFDSIPQGYKGALFLEVSARSFPIRLRPGDSLVQLRILNDETAVLDDDEVAGLVSRLKLVRDSQGEPLKDLRLSDGLCLSVNLGSLEGKREIVGYRSKRCTPVVDLRARGLPASAYWDPVMSPTSRGDLVILEPGAFYIFASRERIVVPEEVCAEMVAIDVRNGEVRTHYAGFFDSGFGLDGSGTPMAGARVVLEVRNMDVPFLLQHGQMLFRLRFFRNSATPSVLYGRGRASNYQSQGLRLGKQFVDDAVARVASTPRFVPETLDRPVSASPSGAGGPHVCERDEGI